MELLVSKDNKSVRFIAGNKREADILALMAGTGIMFARMGIPDDDKDTAVYLEFELTIMSLDEAYKVLQLTNIEGMWKNSEG